MQADDIQYTTVPYGPHEGGGMLLLTMTILFMATTMTYSEDNTLKLPGTKITGGQCVRGLWQRSKTTITRICQNNGQTKELMKRPRRTVSPAQICGELTFWCVYGYLGQEPNKEDTRRPYPEVKNTREEATERKNPRKARPALTERPRLTCYPSPVPQTRYPRTDPSYLAGARLPKGEDV